MKILITGGAGFIGSHLADSLIKNGQKVIIIDNFSTGKKSFLSSKVKIHKSKLSSSKTLKIFEKEKPQILYYLAGPINLRKEVNDSLFENSLNFLYDFKKTLDYSRFSKVKKIIFVSSGGALYPGAREIPTSENYPVCPNSLYGLANLTSEKFLEKYCRFFKLHFIILRFSNIYGPRQWLQGVIPSFIISALENKSLIIRGAGRQTRDFLYIDDAIKALLLSIKLQKDGVYNVGFGKETSLRELSKKIAIILNIKSKTTYHSSEEYGIDRSALDYSKIKKELGWQPKYSLEEGLKETIKWYKNYFQNI